jgi:hypothetical protein
MDGPRRRRRRRCKEVMRMMGMLRIMIRIILDMCGA